MTSSLLVNGLTERRQVLTPKAQHFVSGRSSISCLLNHMRQYGMTLWFTEYA
jgi:hypothetical protein